jgi:hypothetical protein
MPDQDVYSGSASQRSIPRSTSSAHELSRCSVNQHTATTHLTARSCPSPPDDPEGRSKMMPPRLTIRERRRSEKTFGSNCHSSRAGFSSRVRIKVGMYWLEPGFGRIISMSCAVLCVYRRIESGANHDDCSENDEQRLGDQQNSFFRGTRSRPLCVWPHRFVFHSLIELAFKTDDKDIICMLLLT